MKSFNKLSAAQIERLAKLTEECGEISQMVGKTIVHGFENTHPRKPEEGTNRERLEKEIGGLLCVIDIMTRRGDLSYEAIFAAQEAKRVEIGKYLYHQEGL